MLDNLRDAFLTLRGWIYARGDGREAESWDPVAREAYQLARLRSLAGFAQRYIPYYGKLFADHRFAPDDIESVGDLRRLPVLTKDTLLAEQDRFCSYESLRRSIRLRTSGTTGQPMQCYTSEAQWVVEQGAIWRQWGWAGYRFRDRMAIVRSYRPATGEPAMRVDRLRNWAYLSPYHLDRGQVREFLAFLGAWRPKFLRGYPSSLAMLAGYALEEGVRLPTLKAAFTASETLTPAHRAAIREAFGIEVFDHYGQAEISCMLHECEQHAGMHILDDYGIVELLPTGTEGQYRLIATNLHNTAMPLIRYDTGDIVSGPMATCSCGRSFPIVAAIQGRADENLVHERGYPIPSVNIYTFMAKQEGVRRFQVIQEADGHIRVNLDLKPGESVLTGVIETYFRGATGREVKIDATGVMAQTGEGKIPPILQRYRK